VTRLLAESSCFFCDTI